MRKENEISTLWSPELAYVVGLIATDGALSKDERHIEFTSKDRDLVITFQECLGIQVKIGEKKNGHQKDRKYYRAQFGGTQFYRWLATIGLMPNKSKILKELKIPKQYFCDFLRGCFDGDGTIYSYWDPRWKSSFCFYVGFSSASSTFLSWIQREVEIQVGVKGHVTKGNGVEQLRYSKHSAQKVLDAMYHKGGLPCLRRKLVKVQEIITIQKQHARVA